MRQFTALKTLLMILSVFTALHVACSMPVRQNIGVQRKETDTALPAQVPAVTTATLPVIQPTFTSVLNTISNNTLQSVDTDEVLQEISFSGTGFGEPCKKTPAEYQSPEFEQPPAEAELMDMPGVTSCGWSSGETVELIVVYPDGRQVSRTYQADQDDFNPGVYRVDVHYQVGINDIEGVYTLIERGSHHQIQTTINYRKPSGPRLFFPYQDPFDSRSAQNSIVLYGFAPDERVRVYLYQYENGYFVKGKQDLQVGPEGQLSMQLQIDKGLLYFIAIGDVTGEVHEWAYTPDGTLQDICLMKIYCSGAKPSRIGSAQTIRATPVDSNMLTIYKEPGFDQEVITSVGAGTEMGTFGKNKCVSGIWWWYVAVPSTSDWGWVPETDIVNYLIEPVQ